MSRITVEDCSQKVNNRFELVMLASKRARQLFKGAKPLIESDNREVVVALREIADGRFGKQQPASPSSFFSFGSKLLQSTYSWKQLQ